MRRRKHHQIVVTGNQGGILACCNTCKVLVSCNSRAEVEAWERSHGDSSEDEG